MVEEIQQLYAFNTWANRRIFESASKLTPDTFLKDMKNSFPSVRDTLQHILAAEWVWLTRWKGVSPTAFPTDWDTSSHAALQSKWSEIETDQREFVTAVDEETLKKTIPYKSIKGDPFSAPLWQLMRHVVNHSTYHRGQVTTLLRQLGAQAVSTDLVLFYREQDKK